MEEKWREHEEEVQKKDGWRKGNLGERGMEREGLQEEEQISFQRVCSDACQRPPPPKHPTTPHFHELKAPRVCHCHPQRSKLFSGTKDRHKTKV